MDFGEESDKEDSSILSDVQFKEKFKWTKFLKLRRYGSLTKVHDLENVTQRIDRRISWQKAFWHLFKKSLLLKRRSTMILVIEILFPILLLSGLVIVKFYESKKIINQCHFASENLPSVGLFGYIQSMFCNFHALCFKEDKEISMPFSDTFKLLQAIIKVIRSIDQPLSEDVQDWTNLYHLLHKKYNHSTKFLALETINLYREMNARKWPTFFCSICGDDPEVNEGSIFPKLLLEMKSIYRKIPGNAYKTHSMFCSSLLSLFGKNDIKISRLKQFMRGRIMFYPVTPETMEIMSTVSYQFMSLKKLKILLRTWKSNVAKYFWRVMKEDEIFNDIKVTFENCMEDTYNPNQSVCAQLHRFLLDDDISANIYNWKALKGKIDIISNTILDTLNRCFILQNKIIGYNNETKIIAALAEALKKEQPAPIAVIFDKLPTIVATNSCQHLQGDLIKVTYRAAIDVAMNTRARIFKDKYWLPHSANRSDDAKYVSSGLIDIQDMVEEAIISFYTLDISHFRSVGANYSMYMMPAQIKLMPSNCYAVFNIDELLESIIPLGTLLLSAVQTVTTSKAMLEDKSVMIHLMTKCYRLNQMIHWFDWVSANVIFHGATAFLFSVTMVYGGILPNVELSVLVCFTFSCTIITVILCLVLTNIAFLFKLRIRSLFVIYFLMSIPYYLILTWDDINTYAIYLLTLFPQVPQQLGWLYLVRFKRQQYHVDWLNIDNEFTNTYGHTFCECILQIWIDIFVYSYLTWYLNGLMSSTSQNLKPFYFPLTRKYWKSILTNEEKIQTKNRVENTCVIRMIGVHEKSINSKSSSLKNINYKFMKSKITILVGYKNSGVSLMLSLLLGFSRPSRGEIIFNVEDDDLSRLKMTYSPSKNVLYSNMTVAEHIQFYGKLNNLSKIEIRHGIKRLTRHTHMAEDLYSKVFTLSAFQQRLLSIALAFICRENIVVIDEPTKFLGDTERFQVWSLISSLKLEHSVIIGTSDFQEARILGDQLVVMGDGEILAHGSMTELKKMFDQYYIMTFMKSPKFYEKSSEYRSKLIEHIQKTDETAMVDKETEAFIRILVHNDVLLMQKGSDLLKSFLLPRESFAEDFGMEMYFMNANRVEEVLESVIKDRIDQRSQVVPPRVVLKDIAKKLKRVVWNDEASAHEFAPRAKFHRKYTLPWTVDYFVHRIENIFNGFIEYIYFLKEARYIDSNDLYDLEPESQPEIKKTDEMFKYDKLPLWHLKITQFYTVLSMRFFIFSRDIDVKMREIFIPFVALIIICLSYQMIGVNSYNENLQIHPWHMLSELYENSMNTFGANSLNKKLNLSNHPRHNEISEVFNEYLAFMGDKDGWTGTRCFQSRIGMKFLPHGLDFCVKNVPKKNSYDEKVMARGGTKLECPSVKSQIEPPSRKLITGDYLYDLSNYNISEYLLSTVLGNVGHRYGGVGYIVNNDLDELIATREMMVQNTSLFESFTKLTASGNVTQQTKYWKIYCQVMASMMPYTHFARIYLNNKGYTAPGGFLNLYHNMELRYMSEKKAEKILVFNMENLGIVTSFNPLMRESSSLIDFSVTNTIFITTLSIGFTILMTLLPFSSALHLVKQKEERTKYLQIISGMDAQTYWIGHFIYDCLIYLGSALVYMVVIITFGKKAFTREGIMSIFLHLSISYGPAVYSFLYFITLFIQKSRGLLTIMVICNLFLLAVSITLTLVMKTKSSFKESTDIFLIFPPYLYCYALFILEEIEYGRSAGNLETQNVYTDKLNRLITMLTVQSFLYLCLTIVGDNLYLRKAHSKFLSESVYVKRRKAIRKFKQTSISADVKEEIKRTHLIYKEKLHEKDNTLLAYHLHQLEPKGFNLAINDLTLCTNPGECFGMITMGSSKHLYLMKLFTGFELPYLGELYANGINITKNSKKIHKFVNIAFDPDSNLQTHTGDDIFDFYGRIRGIPEHRLQEIKRNIYQLMNLDPIINHLQKDYSISNKKKINCGLVLLGNPKVLLLKKPIEGMNKHAIEVFQKLIMLLRNDGRSLLMSSESIKESEKICDRMCLILQGKVQYIAAVEDMQRNFNNSYVAQLIFNKRKISTIYVLRALAGKCTLLQNYHTHIEVKFSRKLNVYHVFLALNQLYQEEIIDSYFLYQENLTDKATSMLDEASLNA